LEKYTKENNKRVLVFHCGQSKQRGPNCASLFSDYLSQFEHNYEIKVLEGGIKDFELKDENKDFLEKLE
jgi:hypothetical protein